MNKLYTDHIAGQLEVAAWQVEHCIELFEEGATVPFISRYRKERTGALDEMQVAAVRHYWLLFTELEKRKAAILSSIEEQGKLTDDLRRAIENEVDAQTVEDLYLPYRPKRRTRASVAREKGYEPLALKLWNMELDHPERESEEALAGARDIIAEMVAESQPVRAQLRDLYTRWGSITSHVARGKADDADAQNYQNYFDFSQRLDRIPSHRLLAMLRARAQGFVSVKVDVNYPLKDVETILTEVLPRIGERTEQIISGPYYKGVLSVEGGGVVLSIIAECNEDDYHKVERILIREIIMTLREQNVPLK